MILPRSRGAPSFGEKSRPEGKGENMISRRRRRRRQKKWIIRAIPKIPTSSSSSFFLEQ
jgi:hypothetical protein